jgi:hypothetical protein
MPFSLDDLPEEFRAAFNPRTKLEDMLLWYAWVRVDLGPDNTDTTGTWWWGYCPIHQPSAPHQQPAQCEAQYNFKMGTWRCRPASGDNCHPIKNVDTGQRKKAGTLRDLVLVVRKLEDE